ncbi:MAG TPA: hypothetical protein VEK07_25810, partial [Polyangiaceae bacterium]|nr:hypothetical protein [Polyangiaceae bacterium]
DATLAFSVDAGVGLSLLRVRIQPCSGPAAGMSCQLTTLETATAQEAQDAGVKVWATPWTPPAGWKSNDSTSDGGSLLAQYEDDYAQALVGFVQYMQSNGVSIAGVSAQNEPTMATDYDSCVYTASSLSEFIGNHMGPAFADAGLLGPGGMPFGIIAPETVSGGSDFSGFSSAVLGSNAAEYVGTIATHSYGVGPPLASSIAAANKEYWETEDYDETTLPDAGPMASGLWLAQTMDQALTNGVNAWHYWWLFPANGPGDPPGSLPNESLWDNDYVPTKRLYVMGNYSRFVRPGFVRIFATSLPANNVYVTAFSDSGSTQVVIVAINAGTTSVPVNFLFDGVATGSWTSWITSATQNLEQQALPQADAGTDGSPLAYTLQPQSVTTLTGLITGSASPVSIDAGTSIVVAGTDGGDGDSPGSSSAGGPNSGLACSVGRAPRSPPFRPALGASLGACVLARWRWRRRHSRTRCVEGGASKPGRRSSASA